MNIYKALNEITLYIDKHLEGEIEYDYLARILGVNVYTMQRLFTMLVGIPLAEYIRKRRLSCAGVDLYEGKLKVIDVALKYQYDNATSFSRAFERFHGIKPSMVNKNVKLKNLARIVFNEEVKINSELDYEIVELSAMNLYGKGIATNNMNIKNDAPLFFKKFENKYKDKYGPVKYGMITYDAEREESQKYYCLYDKEISNFEHFYLPASKWLRFRINSQVAKEIQDMSQEFYQDFLPSCKYNLRELPEIEYYHDDVTDFLVAIY